ncbi:MAG: long-chain fatty acid--CoA ligase [Actinobacteria bacterium]|nr:long-chain fatty acid--CoA ligase [Actinomycetota bacterium]
MDFNVATILRESAKRRPGKVAVILDDVRLTYAELDQLSDKVAANLVARGLRPGDTVGLQLPNLPQFVVAHFGILKAGGVVVPMNVLLKAPEVAFYLGNSGARTLITFAMVADEAAKGAAEAGVEDVYVVGIPGLLESDVGRSFDELLGGDAPGPQMARRGPEDTAVIIYTSGTTGTPKGAELTHFTLYMNADVPGRLFEFNDDDVVLTVLPLFHVFGLCSVMNICILLGGTMTLVMRFEPAKVLEVIQRDGATVFEGVPTMFFGLLGHPEVDDYDVSSLRIAVSGGAAIPGEVIDRFEEKFGVVILEGYGLSETASTTTFNVSAEERKVYSVGKPIWGVEVDIWDDAGNRLPRGESNVGEIVIRGFNVMKGYLGRPEATEEAFAGGWFHSGDLGYLDDDGFLFIVDRKKELIIRGGYNVYPREIEEVIYQHPAVAEAAVIGVADEKLGEEVKAVVALKPGQSLGERDLIGFVKERVAAYKYPRSVEFRESLPKGATGKILKKELT